MAETRFKLVPVEPTEEMKTAGRNETVTHAWSSKGEHIDDPETVYAAMLQAAPEPSPEMVDELCWMYETTHKHGPADHWEKNADGSWTSIAPLHEKRRNEDRARMRAFLQRIGEQKP